jgi:hypothetical protein
MLRLTPENCEFTIKHRESLDTVYDFEPSVFGPAALRVQGSVCERQQGEPGYLAMILDMFPGYVTNELMRALSTYVDRNKKGLKMRNLSPVQFFELVRDWLSAQATKCREERLFIQLLMKVNSNRSLAAKKAESHGPGKSYGKPSDTRQRQKDLNYMEADTTGQDHNICYAKLHSRPCKNSACTRDHSRAGFHAYCKLLMAKPWTDDKPHKGLVPLGGHGIVQRTARAEAGLNWLDAPDDLVQHLDADGQYIPPGGPGRVLSKGTSGDAEALADDSEDELVATIEPPSEYN